MMVDLEQQLLNAALLLGGAAARVCIEELPQLRDFVL